MKNGLRKLAVAAVVLLCVVMYCVKSHALAQEASVAELSLTQQQKVDKAQEYYAQGKELIGKGDYAAANEAFKKAEQLLGQEEAKNDTALTAADKAQAAAAGKGQKPKEDMGPAPEEDMDEVEGDIMKDEVAVEAKGIIRDAPLTAYMKKLKSSPDNPDLNYNIAVEYLKDKQYKKARMYLLKVIKLNPRDKDAYYNLGVLYDSYLSDKRKALYYFSKFVSLNPRSDDSTEVRTWVKDIKDELKKEK